MPTRSAQPDSVRPFLTRNTILGRLPDVVLDALVRKGQVKTYAKGALIYRRGDPGDSLMVVISGRVKLANTNVGGKEVALDFLGVGDILGETSALDGKERAVDAVALEGSDIFVVSHARPLADPARASAGDCSTIIRVLCERARAGAAIIEDNTLKMRARAARGLLRLARRRGRRGGRRHSDIDDLAGGTRQASGSVAGKREPPARSAEARQLDQDQMARRSASSTSRDWTKSALTLRPTIETPRRAVAACCEFIRAGRKTRGAMPIGVAPQVSRTGIRRRRRSAGLAQAQARPAGEVLPVL